MSDFSKTYQKLTAALRRKHTLGSVAALVDWDEKVNLPPKSGDLRAEQTALLAEIYHEATRKPEIGRWLDQLESASEQLSPEQMAVVRDARREFDRATRLPASLVERKAKAQSTGYHAWAEARAKDDFSHFAPFLKEHIALAQEEASLMEAGNVYDYWVDQFDPGMTQDQIKPLFDALTPELRSLVHLAENAGIADKEAAFRGFPVEGQASFAAEVIRRMGFDFERGRIDISLHPFCSGETRDTRLTTRYDVNDPLESLYSVIHEAGHGMYEQGLPFEHLGTALGSHVGMAIHESQSRLWENQVGRSRAFWEFWESRYRDVFPQQLEGLSLDDIYRVVNRVAVSPIRVSADEVTYNLHIMLRFSLEQKLFNGELAVDDLPDGWNAESERILGLRPSSNAMGCLQDVHWSCGLFGYFPSYSLGNLVAAQWWECLLEAIPDLEAQIAAGEFKSLLGWLRTHIHRKGRLYRTGELVREVSGKELSHEPLVRYLRNRLVPLYQS